MAKMETNQSTPAMPVNEPQSLLKFHCKKSIYPFQEQLEHHDGIVFTNLMPNVESDKLMIIKSENTLMKIVSKLFSL